jgi:two-component system invasion response regulator UvrY
VKNTKLRVLIADDHALVRSGIRRLLRDEPDIEFVGEADTASHALQMVRAEHWDVVIMDIDMPGQNALDVLRIIKIENPNLPVLILTMHAENQYEMRALRAGASGYLTKASAPDHLINAIRKVVEGGAYVSPALVLQLATRQNQKPNRTLDELLSDREHAVLCAIAKGKRLAEIAEELNLSAKTITTYRARVLEKLGKQNNIELVRYALDNNLIS